MGKRSFTHGTIGRNASFLLLKNKSFKRLFYSTFFSQSIEFAVHPDSDWMMMIEWNASFPSFDLSKNESHSKMTHLRHFVSGEKNRRLLLSIFLVTIRSQVWLDGEQFSNPIALCIVARESSDVVCLVLVSEPARWWSDHGHTRWFYYLLEECSRSTKGEISLLESVASLDVCPHLRSFRDWCSLVILAKYLSLWHPFPVTN